MGAWGKGNLENDGAQDALAKICDELYDRLVELLKHPRSHDYLEEEYDELFVRIEMVFALSDRGMISSAPNPIELESLAGSYMKRWLEDQNGAMDDFWSQRKKEVDESLSRLIKISGGGSGGSFIHRLGLISEKMSKPKE